MPSRQEVNGFPRNKFSVSFMYEKQIMFKDEHPSIFSHQMKLLCELFFKYFFETLLGKDFRVLLQICIP